MPARDAPVEEAAAAAAEAETADEKAANSEVNLTSEVKNDSCDESDFLDFIYERGVLGKCSRGVESKYLIACSAY
jgi:hypothetical protein